MDIICIGNFAKLFKDKKKNNGSVSENVSWPQNNFSSVFMIYALFPKRVYIFSINIKEDYHIEDIL